jgi:hypothetical protein
MRLNQTCILFLKLNESEQREFFINYRKKRDDDINTYINSKIKQPKKQAVKSNKEITVTITETEKLLLKKLGISMSEFKKLKGSQI